MMVVRGEEVQLLGKRRKALLCVVGREPQTGLLALKRPHGGPSLLLPGWNEAVVARMKE